MGTKKLLSVFLAVIMIVGLIPVTVFANDNSETVYVAEINGNKYDTLLGAVNAAEEGDTITMISDIEILDEEEVAANTIYNMPCGSTLDLNGYNLALRMTRAIFAGENITIKNGTMTPPAGKNNDYVLYIGYADYKSSVTVENVEIIKGGINVSNADVTLNNVTATVNPSRKYYAVYAGAATNVIINSGSYTGGKNKKDVAKATDATVTIYGGTYANADTKAYIAEGFVAVENADGKFEVFDSSKIVAEVNGSQYIDLQTAINAANAGDTVKLLKDVNNTDSYVLINKSLTLDLGEYTITGNVINDGLVRICAPDAANEINVTINATTGGVKTTGNCIPVYAGHISTAKTNVTINGGNYESAWNRTIYQNNGICTINGGSYKATYGQLLLDNYDGSEGSFVINDGKFYKFNPACLSINKGEHHNHNSIAKGKTAVYEDGWYTVVAGDSNFVAQISSTYESLDRCCFSLLEAVNEANAGNTITLLEDIILTENVVYMMPENSVLDLNGKKMTIKQDTAKFAGKNITIKNGTVVAYNSKTNYPLYVGDGTTKTTATVENVTIKNGGVYVKNYATVTLKNNEIVVGNNKWKYAVIVEDNGDAIIESGKYFGGKGGHDIMCWKSNIDVYGGTFKYQHVRNFTADGYAAIKLEGGTYVVLSEDKVVASIGKINYLDLQFALNDAKSGATVKLAKDVEASDEFIISKGITLDLGEYTINSIAAKSALRIVDDESIEVTVNATTGGINATGYAINSGNIDDINAKTTLTINGGNFVSASSTCIYQNNGLATINGGSYKATGATGIANGEPTYNDLVLNNKDYYLGEFMINGGKFYGFNPACMSINKNDHHDHDSIAEGKVGILDEEGWFTVAEGTLKYMVICDCKYPSSVHGHCYASYEEAEHAIVMNGNCQWDKIVEIAE